MNLLKVLRGVLWVAVIAALVSLVVTAGAGPSSATALELGVLTLQLDLVSALLLVLVLGVGAVVAAYSVTHLDGEPRVGRYAIALGSTVAGLTLAVTAVHLPLLWVGWVSASVGLVALVRWRHAESTARRPARYVAAWLATGDGLILAALVGLVAATGTTDRTQLAAALPDVSAVTITALAGLLAAGGVIRSALVPAHRWLPETAAAPTPVSALLHAGIVNGAGVLAVLLWPVFAAAPVVLVALVVIGALSILAASAIASVRPDVKGRLAASTTAQMGFMTIQVGIGAPAAALFHLLGHGFYKATLFLGAGGGVDAFRRGRNAPAHGATGRSWLRGAVAVVPPASVVVLMAATVTPPLHGVGTVVLYAAATTTAGVLVYQLLDPAVGATLSFRAWASAGVIALLVSYLVGLNAFDTAVAPVIGATSSPLLAPVLTALVVLLLALGTAAAVVDHRARSGNAPGLVVRAVAAAMTPRRPSRRKLSGEPPAVITTPVERARARACVAAASQVVAPAWPLERFVASNPLAGLEHLTFDDATERAARIRGARTGLDTDHYRRLYAAGHITDAALTEAIVEHGDRLPLPPSLPQASWTAITRTLLTGENAPGGTRLRDAARRAARSLGARTDTLVGTAGQPTTLSRQVDDRLGTALDRRITDAASAWLAYLLADDGVRWRASRGPLFPRWRGLAEHAAFDTSIGVSGFADALSELPGRADEAVAHHLSAMGIADAGWSDYLAATLARLPGWASHVAWLERETRDDDVSLLDLAAIVLSIERFVVDAETRSAWGEPGTAATIATHPLEAAPDAVGAVAELVEAVARAGELDPDVLAAMDDVSLIALVRYARAVQEAAPAMWRCAHEATFRDPVVADLASAAAGAGNDVPPDVQAVFCIDVRSEPLRRHLEATGRVQTLGFAGFFALPFHYRQLDAADGTDQCPVLLTPHHDVQEVAEPQHHLLARRALSGARAMQSTTRAVSDAQRAPNAAFSFAEAAGWLYAPVTVLRTVAPAAWLRLRAASRRAVRPAVPTRQTIDQTRDGLGFAPDEQLFLAEAALRTMGLTRDFARLVVITGHGSHTENNPFEAAYDCGACGGNPGAANARALAAMLNTTAVRSRLSQVGIEVPATTWFLPAEHGTTEDTVTLLDCDQVPASHWQDVARLRSDLDAATGGLAVERIGTLPGAPRVQEGQAARRHVQRRAADWAQTRPEWGLAGNAAFVVGDRAVTAGCDLQGRAFLHSYRWQDDEDGAALEVILTAPMVVAEWINTQYYFSSVDPDHFGSGSKVLHNLVGRVGVLSGPHGDLKPGLPLQAVADRVDAEGVHLRHAPLRLLTVVQAPLDRVAAVIARNPMLQRLFGNGWVSLVVLDPSCDEPQRYTPEGQWRPWFTPREEPSTQLHVSEPMTTTAGATS